MAIVSDLIGTVTKFEPGTLYINKRRGVVVLAGAFDPSIGVILHAINSQFKIGQLARLDNPDIKFEKLTGKLILSNYPLAD